ncbi:ABC transporter ATP-binding protein [Microbacterium sp. A84]|uniref:ABC transporter ATP-binding protein n=1 Tax=Microbacterium sp. A84 TaxID=3450715 RepID=UPI003F42118C
MAIIEVRDLVKRYGDRTVLDGIGFDVEESEIFGILGPNGAGKSTLVESIAGLRIPESGTIQIAGLDPQRDRRGLPQVLGVQLQQSELPGKLKVGEALELYGSFYREPLDWRELIGPLGLSDKVRVQYRHLSGGQKQRLSIALALIGNPKVVILDELTTGLDPQARRDVWDLIENVRARGVTVVLVSHFMEEVERLCDRLAVIDGGNLVALDTPAGLIRQSEDRQLLRFRPSALIDTALLIAVPEVISVQASGGFLEVTGTGELLLAVTKELDRHHVTATDLRLEQTTLEDAFVSLTGRSLNDRN